MKKTKLKYGLMIAVMAPFLMGCPKPSPAPSEPDTEVQSAIDASYASFLVSDIDMICGFALGGDNTNIRFYGPAPGASGFSVPGAPQNTDQTAVSFNQTKCLDGRLRDGSVVIKYPNVDPNARYYSKYDFHAQVTLSAYKVDGWLIRTVDGAPCHIYNLLPSPSYTATAGLNLSWSIEGSFEFIHPTDATKNMTWTGKLTKTLVNTGDRHVFDPSRLVAIDWSLAKVEYKGSAKGTTSGDVPYSFVIDATQPLGRDFTCFSDIIGGVTTTSPLRTWEQEFHPFIRGVVSFTTAGKYPRQVYYGNEGNTDLPAQCDNSGEVLIKGQSYRVDFMK
jgi:hypothetical protein